MQSKNFSGNPFLSIIIGNNEEKVDNPMYVSSSGWSIFLSRKKPCPWKNFTKNPLSAIYVAALAVGEIFKLLVKDIITVEIKEEFIYDFITHGRSNQPIMEPLLPPFLNLNLTIIGCGGVAQGICFALSQIELRGRIILIDDDYVDESNKQRYILAFDENIGISKTHSISSFLLGRGNNLLTTLEFNLPYEEAISVNQSLFKMKDVLISVDNKKTRINLQAALPKLIWNVWTDTQSKTLRYGIGKHDFSKEYECLACSYFPTRNDTPSQIELNALILGITKEEFLYREHQNDSIKEEDLSYIFNTHKLSLLQIQKLKSLIGLPFQNILHGPCGAFNIRLGEKNERTPATHIPTLAGTYAVIIYILDQLKITFGKKFESVAEFDAFSYPSENCLIKKYREQNCICSDPIYQEVFKNKWKH